jgi:hypothetical protein
MDLEAARAAERQRREHKKTILAASCAAASSASSTDSASLQHDDNPPPSLSGCRKLSGTASAEPVRSERHIPHSLDRMKQRVSALMALFQAYGVFLPAPDTSMSTKGKVWSSRNYGQDRKRQRKRTERDFVRARIAQLEDGLRVRGILFEASPDRVCVADSALDAEEDGSSFNDCDDCQ